MGQTVKSLGNKGPPEAENTESARLRIYSAAEAEFRAHGFHATTMDAVARHACCSKKTIYKLFNSKEELFILLIDRFKASVKQMEIDPSLPPAAALEDVLLRIGRVVLGEESIVTLRMVLSEYCNNPSLLEAAERLLGGGIQALEDYLGLLEQRDGYRFGPHGEAARLLIGMAIGAYHYERLVGQLPHVPEPELRRRIQRSVAIFLAGNRPGQLA